MNREKIERDIEDLKKLRKALLELEQSRLAGLEQAKEDLEKDDDFPYFLLPLI